MRWPEGPPHLAKPSFWGGVFFILFSFLFSQETNTCFPPKKEILLVCSVYLLVSHQSFSPLLLTLFLSIFSCSFFLPSFLSFVFGLFLFLVSGKHVTCMKQEKPRRKKIKNKTTNTKLNNREIMLCYQI